MPTPQGTYRRRTTDVSGGNGWSNNGNQYGYTNTNQMHNNLGPNSHQTSYGYSGQNAVKPGYSMTTVMAAGAAGALAGGAAGYYFGSDRRRRYAWGGMNDPCRHPTHNGFVDCNSCRSSTYDQYQCQPADECWGPSGCEFKAPENLARDDIMTSGFVPWEVTFPLTLTISALEGYTCGAPDPSLDQFNTVSSPAKPELYATLQNIDALGSPPSAQCDTETPYACGNPARCSRGEKCGSNGMCVCEDGYCYGSTTKMCEPGTGGESGAWAAAVAAVFLLRI